MLTAGSPSRPAITRWPCSTLTPSNWFQVTTNYWGGGGPGTSGITAGPLTAPGASQATPGQSTYNPGTWAYPATYGAGGDGENFWVDVEVTPT